jgi:hypothetical protein
MKGLVKAVHQCPHCHGEFPDDEYDQEEDSCLYCLFPESSKTTPPIINHEYGFPRNITPERHLLDNLENTPEKQSEQASIARDEYKSKKIYRKNAKLYK